MGSQWRHFKALTRKNWISWKRNLAGSIVEIACPVLFMMVLLVLRQTIKKEMMNNVDLTDLRHGLYPMTTWDFEEDKYKLSFSTLSDQSEKLRDFMVNANVTTDKDKKDYTPMLDARGPMMFFPPHCVEVKRTMTWASPIIATIKSDSIIQQKLKEQLQVFFENQAGMHDVVMDDKNQWIRDLIQEHRDKGKTKAQLKSEAQQNAKQATGNKFQGQDRNPNQTFFPDMQFEWMEFDNVADLNEYMEHKDLGKESKPGICFAFTVHEQAKNDYELELFFNDGLVRDYRSIPEQGLNAAETYQMLPWVHEYARYAYFGFNYMQNMAANTILRHVKEKEDAQITAITIPMKIKSIPKDPFAFLLMVMGAYFFMMMYIPMLFRTSYRLISEKEIKARELMRMMGMNDTPYWLSWFFYHTCVNTMLSFLVWLVFFGVFAESSLTIIFMFVWLYGQSLFGYMIVWQSLVSTARMGAVCVVVFYFASSVTFVVTPGASRQQKIMEALMPTTCMSHTLRCIVGFEQNGLGVQFDSLNREYQNFSVLKGLIMLCVDGVWWLLFGIYLDYVMPREFGKRRHVCFCFGYCFRSCFTNKKEETEKLAKVHSAEMAKRSMSLQSVSSASSPTKSRGQDLELDKIIEKTSEFECKFMKKDGYEPITPEIAQLETQKRYMKITDLMKEYDNGLRAVNGINLKIYADQIFVLLGHNGAGKTSTISMLTGLFEPTKGKAEAFGVDMFEDVETVRTFLGLCPQHDVLFELLTPEEHLEIFYDFKGADSNPQKKAQEIQKLLKDCGVDDKKHDLAGQLSGGNKRKLSAAIALCGGSKFVVFDEPTSGMDLSARRQLWSMLKEYKKDRIILLTTHYMDEADILGDRIGIMTSGQLSCLGSPMFLKRKFGVGYNLTMLKSSSEINNLVLPYCHYRLGTKVQKISEIQTEITLQIPQEYSECFREFFTSFDTDLARLQILAYGMTVTTLEDVFMKVGHMSDPMEVMEEKEENEELRAEVYGTQLSRQFSVLNFISIQDLSKAYAAAQQLTGDQQGIHGHALNLMKNQYQMQQQQLNEQVMRASSPQFPRLGQINTPSAFPQQNFLPVMNQTSTGFAPRPMMPLQVLIQNPNQLQQPGTTQAQLLQEAQKKLQPINKEWNTGDGPIAVGNLPDNTKSQMLPPSSDREQLHHTQFSDGQSQRLNTVENEKKMQINNDSREEGFGGTVCLQTEADNTISQLDMPMDKGQTTMGPDNTIDAQKFTQIPMDDFLKRNKGDLDDLLISNQMPRGPHPDQVNVSNLGNFLNPLGSANKEQTTFNLQEVSQNQSLFKNAPGVNQDDDVRQILSFNEKHSKPPALTNFLKGRQADKIAANDMNTRNQEKALTVKVVPSPHRNQRKGAPKVIQQKHHMPEHLESASEDEMTTKVFSLSESATDETFCNNFCAILHRRMLAYTTNWKFAFFDLIIPMLVMISGIGFTAIDIYGKAPSVVLHPSRISELPQTILFDKYVMENPADGTTLEKFAKDFPGQDYFNFHFTDEAMSIDQFNDFLYYFGTNKVPEYPYFYSAYQMYEANNISSQYMFYNYINMTNRDAPALYPQFMYEAILKEATNDANFTFKTRNSPFPPSHEVMERKAGTDSGTLIFLTATTFSMLLTTIAGQLVNERTARLKHIQIISGMQLGAYWAANFLIDFIKLELNVAVALFTFHLAGQQFKSIWFTYVLFPFGAIPFTYVSTFLFNGESSAQTFTIFLHWSSIGMWCSLIFFLRWLKNTERIADILNNILRALIPSYSLGSSIYLNAMIKDLADFRAGTDGSGPNISSDLWGIDMALGDGIIQIGHGVVWFTVLIAIELGFARRVKEWWYNMNSYKFPPPDDSLALDEDVQAEEERVHNLPDQFLQISVKNLRKIYMRGSGPCNPGQPLRAVERLSFGLSKGECFALLGVNGAGKSTTFKVLTAEEEPTSGSVSIKGMDLKRDFQKVRKLIGYCPQYDPLFESLTVEQNINYFSAIKGIPRFCRGKLVEDAISKLGLHIHRGTPAGKLSGGNKRKLSVAIAIVGNPPIIMLDEPSAGMDPEARRFMWSVVARIASQKTSAVILTSHLMEEAEALSTKMGIMVKGGIFKCFGSSQHIKNKFGVGFEVEVKLETPKMNLLVAAMEEKDQLGDHLCTVTIRKQQQVRINFLGALAQLVCKGRLQPLLADKIRKELVITYRQSNEKINIQDLEEENFDYEAHLGNDKVDLGSLCSASVFAEKLFNIRNLYGTIKEISRVFGSIELLEQYGNYMRLRVSRQDKTIGQMFTMIDELKTQYKIDQYSISQTTLEQIFQSFANLNFDSQVQTFELSADGQENLQVQ